MRQSELFQPTYREAPGGEESKNAILLIRGGYVQKIMAGNYALLPLGLRVFKKITEIVREEMNALPRTQELLMPSLQPRELWEESGRWATYTADGEVYTVDEDSMMLGPTHEEIATHLFRTHVSSYKQLPLGLYQIQTKFRKELRAKSGLLRGREFQMKDLYSFHVDEADCLSYYEQVAAAYLKIYARCGLEAIRTKATGGLFSKYSDEFQVATPAGEDTIYLRSDGLEARNKELVPDEKDPELLDYCGGEVKTLKSIEVGNIFPLGKRFSKPMKAQVTDADGSAVDVWMGCYGIGLSRLLGAVTELFGIEKGSISWPESLAPYRVHLLDLTSDFQGSSLYRELVKTGIEVLYDDRPKTAGEKFADADLIGAPVRLVISKRSLEAGGIERSYRGEKQIVTLEEILGQEIKGS